MRKFSTPFYDIEARVLGELLGEPGLLATVPDLEVNHFADLRHRAAFASMRELEQLGERACAVAVADDIAMRDLANGKNVASTCSPAFLCSLVMLPSYEETFTVAAPHVWAADLGLLRDFAAWRASL